ncbi:hypothetical protein Q4Q78_15180 [Morganella morganii]
MSNEIKVKTTGLSNNQLNNLIMQLKKHVGIINAAIIDGNHGESYVHITGSETPNFMRNYANKIIESLKNGYEMQ